MAKAIVIRAAGGPEVLVREDVSVAQPGPGQLRIRHEAVGVNFHDIYVRSGLYKTLPLPGIPGLEAAGVVEQVGEGVGDFAPGDRIAYLDAGYGAYASERLLDAAKAVKLPGGISTALAATVLLKGLTAGILATRVHPIQPGERVLVHAAAGGVGRLLAQWAAGAGAFVIGTAGSPEKAAIAKASGCEEVILYREEDFARRVMAITGGLGVNVVYDAIGRDTFDGSLAVLATRGHLVNYGQASGPIPPFEISRLAPKSATITRPGYSHYLQDRGAMEAMAAAMWNRVMAGTIRVEAGQAYPLAEAARAHAALEHRVAGPLILIP